jgi:nicotinamide-nucleotide amidase
MMSAPIEKRIEEIAIQLKKHHLKLVTAESCTGGGLGYWLTSLPGSSEWFERGFITYSNEAKIEMLGINPSVIASFGAVSEKTAREMAIGALTKSGADVSMAITGIAGPSGGSAEKPVGTVWFAWADKNLTTQAEMEIFVGDRQTIRIEAINKALQHLLDLSLSF